MRQVREFSLRFLALCLLLVVFNSIGYAGNATISFPSTYPGMVCGNADCSIRWSEELGLASLEGARSKLGKVIDNGCYTMVLSDSYDNITDTQMACTCNDLMKYVPSEYSGCTWSHECNIMICDWLKCITIDYMAHAYVAEEDYLSSFVLNSRSIDILLHMFGPALGDDDIEDFRVTAVKGGESWIEYDRHVQYRMEKGRLEAASYGFIVYFEEYGRGDFDGDGFQDMLITVDVWFGGSASDERLVLLTKTSPDAGLTITRKHDYSTP